MLQHLLVLFAIANCYGKLYSAFRTCWGFSLCILVHALLAASYVIYIPCWSLWLALGCLCYGLFTGFGRVYAFFLPCFTLLLYIFSER